MATSFQSGLCHASQTQQPEGPGHVEMVNGLRSQLQVQSDVAETSKPGEWLQ